VFGNLEGPITTFAPVADYRDAGPNHFRFTFATTTAETLARAGFSAVSLGNNHISNFGTEGVTQTKEWLGANGIGFVGGPTDTLAPWRATEGDFTLAVYAYDPWHIQNPDALLAEIASEDTDTFVVVLAHWGEEYDTTVNEKERALARRFVDAGARIVVGSHPHVLQEKEQYEHAWIYYSLGNFVFDQYFSAEVRCGGVLTYTLFGDGSASTTESFIELSRDGTTVQSACRDEFVTRS
jgi:poly-gamma-glutamate synthesis protein (capsule biosynthesis protein)